jgi:hypothetical protein
MAGVGASMASHGELAGEGKEGEGEEGEEGAARGRGMGWRRAAGGGTMGRACGLLLLLRVCSLLCVRELDVRKERRRKERRKRKGRKRKKKKNGKISKILGRKRQFMKLVKIIFVQGINLIIIK